MYHVIVALVSCASAVFKTHLNNFQICPNIHGFVFERVAALSPHRYSTQRPQIPYNNAIDYLRLSSSALRIPILAELHAIVSDTHDHRIRANGKRALDHITRPAGHHHQGHTQLAGPF